ncbi:TcaA second domain-containing protein [Staphylococcus caprae]|uniref:TcaA second domain-containing protein n=1 Tax=Staphylococcus caprae TaxID=29380 RepID=UPI0014520B02|nr:hypothetical protein [Staphylococcus caprae]QJE26697.1 hypothetical protein HHJ99_13075 [Staphylococcus caprae]
MEDNSNNQSRMKKRKRKKYTRWGIGLAVIIIIMCGIYFAMQLVSPAEDLEDFEKAVLNKNYHAVAKTLSTNDKKMSKTEAQLLVTYLLKNKGKDQFKEDIDRIQKATKHNHNDSSQYGVIKDNKGRPIIEVNRDGKKFFLVDKISIEPQYINVYINGDKNKPTYEYRTGEKTSKVKTLSNQETKVGQFVPGNYTIDTKKWFNSSKIKGSSDGKLAINTDEYNKGQNVIVKPEFKDTKFKVNIFNADDIKPEDVDIHVNNTVEPFKTDKEYGDYPNSADLKVYASSDIGGKTVKSETKNVEQIKNQDLQTIDLKFDESEIEKQKDKESDIKNKAKEFMKDYTKDLTKAYQDVKSSDVDKYFENHSETGEHIKGQIDSKKKDKFRDPIVTDTQVDGNEVTLKLSKSNKKNDRIKSRYTLEYDDKKDTFKIKDYQDIR